MPATFSFPFVVWLSSLSLKKAPHIVSSHIMSIAVLVSVESIIQGTFHLPDPHCTISANDNKKLVSLVNVSIYNMGCMCTVYYTLLMDNILFMHFFLLSGRVILWWPTGVSLLTQQRQHSKAGNEGEDILGQCESRRTFNHSVNGGEYAVNKGGVLKSQISRANFYFF